VGEPVADTTIDDETRERPLGDYRVHVDPDQSLRFAAATGEAPPHSMSDDAARQEGFERRILQGMCTFGLAVSGLVHELGPHPDRLRRLAGRFSRPCYNDTDLTVSMFDAGATTTRDTRVAWEAGADGDLVIRHGIIEFD
jgi:acyl dehydratase